MIKKESSVHYSKRNNTYFFDLSSNEITLLFEVIFYCTYLIFWSIYIKKEITGKKNIISKRSRLIKITNMIQCGMSFVLSVVKYYPEYDTLFGVLLSSVLLIDLLLWVLTMDDFIKHYYHFSQMVPAFIYAVFLAFDINLYINSILHGQIDVKMMLSWSIPFLLHRHIGNWIIYLGFLFQSLFVK